MIEKMREMQHFAPGHDRRGVPWSESEIAMLLALFEAKRPLSEIAARLQRTYAVEATSCRQCRRRASGAPEAWPPHGRWAWPESELERSRALIAEGLSNAEIAGTLHRAIVSVEVRRSRVRVRDRTVEE